MSDQPAFNSERAQRMEDRRKRLQTLLTEIQANANNPVTDNTTENTIQIQQAVAPSDIQVTKSLTHIMTQKQQYASHLSELSKKQFSEAAQIFSNDDTARNTRRKTLEDEKANSQQQDNAFQMRFASLLDKDVQSMAAGIVELRQITIKSLTDRDVVIKAFEDYLNQVDDDFLRLIRENTLEVDDVIGYSRKVIKQLQADCTQQIQQVETAFDAERGEFIKSAEKELDDLRESVWTTENTAMEGRITMAEQYHSDINQQILKDYDEYTSLKRRLESEGVALRHQLEEMRSVYHLNTDKLEYNYKLLASRDIECQNLIVQQKKKISKLQDQLTQLISKYQQIDEQLRSENLELSTSYRRLANIFCELQIKFKLFEAQDTKKFRELWTYHEHKIANHLKDLLLAEQVINESVVCSAPKREIDEQSMLQQIHSMLKRLQASAGVVEDAGKIEIDQNQQNLVDITRSINPIAACTVGQANATRLLIELARKVSFMASEDLLKTLNPGEKLTEQMRTDALLATLGIRNASELDLLFQHATQGGSCQKLKERGEIVQALIEFASELEKRRDLGGNQTAKPENKRGGIWDRKAVAQFWKEIGQIVSPEKATAWKLLEETLKRYQEVLLARVDLVERNDLLAAQNEELRGLLQQYVDGERRGLQVTGQSQYENQDQIGQMGRM
ncbi:hypothetical protein SS50377_24626 [Spironucleus salmonicida]|uniref:Dynein regulatory complex protein 1/2 N-terminal domain-containing protein n=1 Tax=Spironucleus salmonicida TaxID=348837 RepID=V6LJG3_9EUKA|nr:hypothetical protein SS50377_24626 [Spironucleus salmonicida]|eukprot:EST44523.1 hypothetical protein SS50377_15521 [Spironucleus salmonicida]